MKKLKRTPKSVPIEGVVVFSLTDPFVQLFP